MGETALFDGVEIGFGKHADGMEHARVCGRTLDVELGKTTGIARRESSTPKYFELCQNYPNPFNPTTTISYILPERSSVSVSICDLQGRTIKSFTYDAQSAGTQRVVWNGTNSKGSVTASGVYIYRIRASSLASEKTFDKSAKMLLLQ